MKTGDFSGVFKIFTKYTTNPYQNLNYNLH